MYKIRNLNGREEAPVKFDLSKPRIIGRGNDCDVQLFLESMLSTEISRRHAFLVQHDGEPYLGNVSGNVFF